MSLCTNYIISFTHAGCGGYVSGRGKISTPNYSLINSLSGDCLWFIEASQSENTILLQRNYLFSNRRPPAVAIISHLAQPPMIASYFFCFYYNYCFEMANHNFNFKNCKLQVYDGWNTSGEVLYDSKEYDSQDKSVVFDYSQSVIK